MRIKAPPFLRGLRKNLSFYNSGYLTLPFFDLFCGGKNRPVFFDIDETYPALRELDKNYETIRAELEALLKHQDDLPVYHQLDTDLIRASGRVDRDKRWNVFMLF